MSSKKLNYKNNAKGQRIISLIVRTISFLFFFFLFYDLLSFLSLAESCSRAHSIGLFFFFLFHIFLLFCRKAVFNNLVSFNKIFTSVKTRNYKTLKCVSKDRKPFIHRSSSVSDVRPFSSHFQAPSIYSR